MNFLIARANLYSEIISRLMAECNNKPSGKIVFKVLFSPENAGLEEVTRL